MNRPLCILHLEDDPFDAELIRETLLGEGLEHTIINVDDRPSFLLAVEQRQFDLIIADFALPTFNGHMALTIAQEKCPDVPFIFVSGAIGEERAIESLKLGATDYVLKHSLSGLIPAIQRALREVEERTQRQQAVAALAAHARQQAAVAQLGQLGLMNTDLTQLMDEAVTLVANALVVEYTLILQQLVDKQTLRMVAGVGWQEGLVRNALVEAGLASQAGYTLLSQEPVVVADITSETRFSGSHLVQTHQIVSSMTVVVSGTEQPFGVLGAYTRQPRTFTEDDINFLQSMAHVLATAIERKQQDEQLRQSRNQLSAILEGITEGIVVQRPDGSIIYVNEIAAQFSGYPSIEAYLNDISSDKLENFELRQESGEPFPISQLPANLALQGQATTDVLIRFRHMARKEERWAIVSATPIFDELGQVQLAVNIFRDVTERSRLYEAEKAARQQAEATAIRIASLQVVTASLTEALTPLQVAQVVEEQTVAVVGAQAAVTLLLRDTPAGQVLEVLHSIGYPEEHVEPFRQFSIDTPFPLSEAVRQRQPIFLSSRAIAAEKFPIFITRAIPKHQAWAALPLMIEGRVTGSWG
ncbi:MAG: GAF domain-containing protein [Chloroflexi bacterium]|nr:GAF domain-containing protein [Chloroflexota bacterium]